MKSPTPATTTNGRASYIWRTRTPSPKPLHHCRRSSWAGEAEIHTVTKYVCPSHHPRVRCLCSTTPRYTSFPPGRTQPELRFALPRTLDPRVFTGFRTSRRANTLYPPRRTPICLRHLPAPRVPLHLISPGNRVSPKYSTPSRTANLLASGSSTIKNNVTSMFVTADQSNVDPLSSARQT